MLFVPTANSYGSMDRGIDYTYRKYFGAELESRIQEFISINLRGLQPKGSAFTIQTGNNSNPYMIVAPTMISPEMIELQSSERAFRAVLREAI